MGEKQFEIGEDTDWEIITAERDRIMLINGETHQLVRITPTKLTGKIIETHENIKELTFCLSDKLNLKIWRSLCSSIYLNDKELTYGEIFDHLCWLQEQVDKLDGKNKELEKELERTDLALHRTKLMLKRIDADRIAKLNELTAIKKWGVNE